MDNDLAVTDPDLEQKISHAVKVYTALLAEKQNRLSHGLTLRQQMHDQLKKGLTPTNSYRPAWLRESALAVIGTLQAQAEKFNNAHGDDQISVPDLMDALATAINLLKVHSEKKG